MFRQIRPYWMVFIIGVSLILTTARFSWGGTALGDLAASMQPETWAELVTNNINLLVDGSGGGQGHQIPYAEGMKWDPVTRRAYYVGSDDPLNTSDNCPLFVAYDETTNTWVKLSNPYWFSCVSGGHLHQYDAFPIDINNRILYFANGAGYDNYKYNITTGEWTSFPALGGYSCCEAMEYFPEMHALIHVRTGTLYRFNDGGSSWQSFGPQINTNYHSFAEYNPILKEVLIGGGNGVSNIYKINSSGVVTQLTNAPFEMRIPSKELTYDPVSGVYLYIDYAHNFYSFNSATDTWTSLPTTGVPADIFRDYPEGPDGFNSLATPISTYGVIMFTECRISGPCKAYLYKHAQKSDTTPPLNPKNLQVK